MLDIFLTIKALWENEIIRTIIIYYLISIGIWFTFFLVLMRQTKATEISQSNEGFASKKYLILCSLSMFFLLILLARALHYVGYLPYGQDTADYTYHAMNVSISGYWRGPEGYYRPYHTSAVFLTLLAEILGSMKIAYLLLLTAFLISYVVSLGVVVSKISRVNVWLSTFITTLLFIVTPNLGGFDLLQQYVSVVYATVAVSIILSDRNFSRLVLFLICIWMSVVTHLTSVIMSLILLAMYFVNTKVHKVHANAYKMDFLVFIFLAIAYLFHGVNPDSIMLSLYKSLTSLLQGTVEEYTIRALMEVPASKIFLFSWVLLPSIASATLLIHLITKIKPNLVKAFTDNVYNYKFVLIMYVFSLGLIFLGVLTGLSVYLVRYFALPSYSELLFSVSIMLSWFIEKNRKKLTVISLLLLLIVPYAYSAINSSARSPWMEEPRLAPVTQTDRMEMLMLAKYGADDYFLYGWHDVYVPYEEVERKPNILSGGSYYPIHDILIKAAEGEALDIPKNSYLVPLKEVLTAKGYENYNVIYDGCQHVIMVLK